LYWHDEPNEPTKEGPLFFGLHLPQFPPSAGATPLWYLWPGTKNWGPLLLAEVQQTRLPQFAQGIFLLSTERLSRSTLHLKEGGEWSLYVLLLYGVLQL
jgi:hypothetical protein